MSIISLCNEPIAASLLFYLFFQATESFTMRRQYLVLGSCLFYKVSLLICTVLVNNNTVFKVRCNNYSKSCMQFKDIVQEFSCIWNCTRTPFLTTVACTTHCMSIMHFQLNYNFSKGCFGREPSSYWRLEGYRVVLQISLLVHYIWATTIGTISYLEGGESWVV